MAVTSFTVKDPRERKREQAIEIAPNRETTVFYTLILEVVPSFLRLAVGHTDQLEYNMELHMRVNIRNSQASFLTKKLNIGGKRVNLAIWDTAGQERFHALGPIYYRDSNGAILVYDITDENSFQKVKNWVKELRKMLGNEISLCIVGNKIDLEKERHVSTQEAESYAESVGAKHYHTSAKQNKGIEELFLDLCKRRIETAQVDERAKGNGSSPPGTARRGIQIIDDEPQVQSGGGGCCSSR
ncbi:ras-related protein Rab-21-like [Nycticebus coucang]|uniref:ras-related protein Rab-21-like n=1 Tax=Nycticebus coucang TaxID=9470 RepID=UPI00234D07F0|nr:ras-related protein Rab-21-like [Nycticebus coucang]